MWEVECWVQENKYLKSELIKTQNEKDRVTRRLDDSNQEVGSWRDEARGQTVETTQLKRRVRRFEGFCVIRTTC